MSAPSLPGEARPSVAPLVGWRSGARLGGLLVVAAALVSALVLAPRTVTNDAMRPSLHSGDLALVNRFTYRVRLPFRGDIVELRDGDLERVIGIGGDVVDVHRGRVFIGGAVVEEPYLGGTEDVAEGARAEAQRGTWRVPGGTVLVVPDQRSRSTAPRLVSIPELRGRVTSVLLPLYRSGIR